MAKRKPRKAAAPSKKPQVVTPEMQETPKTQADRTALTKEIAVADPRFGFAFSGFYRHVNYNPDDLISRKGLRIISDMRRDEQVKAALMTKKLATIASGGEFVVEDKERADDKELERQKTFLEFCESEMAGTMEAYLLQAMTALDYGFSVTEPTYKHIDYGEFKGMLGWKALKVRRPDQIEFETDQFGNLTENGVIQGNKPLPAKRFAIYSYQKEFDNYYGTSDLRSCYRPWFVKDTLIKFMAMCMERYGAPIPVAKITQTLSDSDQTLLLQIMKNLQQRTGIIIPSTVELEFVSPGDGAQAAYGPIFKQLDQWISMAILMPSLIGAGGGEEKVGSNARAETQFDTFMVTVEQLRKDLQEFINDRIVKVLIDLNFDVEDGVYPKFKFKELTHQRKLEIMKAYNEAMAGQVITKTADDETWYREMADFPELGEDEIAVGTREAAEQQMKDQVKMAGDMAKVAPAVPPAPSTKDKGPERNPFQQKKAAQFEQRDYHAEHDQSDHGNWADNDLPGGGGSSGDRVYGDLPSGKEWEQRIKRDKLDPAKLRSALEKSSRGYKVRVWAYPGYDQPSVVKDESSPNGVKTIMVPSYSTYRYRRDGKIERSWVPVSEDRLEFDDKRSDFAQRDDLPRTPGSHLFAGQNDAPRDFDEKCLNSMIKRGQALGYDEEALNFAAGFMAAPASKYQSLNEMAERGEALGMDQKTIEFAMGFLCESLDLEKREMQKERKYREDYHLQGQHDQEDHGNRGGGLADVAIKKGGFTYKDGADRAYEFDPNQPRDERGRWTDDGGGLAAHKDIADVISRQTELNPFKDANQDGVTDASRVGVPGFEVPPPPDIPRLPNLTADERAIESKFADAFEADPKGMTAAYMAQVAASGAPNVFSTDDAKMLSPEYARDKDSRAIYNVAVHQTANAVAKRAFVEYLDSLPPDKKTVLVTAGGVAAGKGYALDHIDDSRDVVGKVGAVWDTAGEQNSTELPWVLSEARKRGITPIFAYVDADPTETFARVVSRAQKSGRMVDADLFADSYAVGARNFLSFSHNHRDQAKFLYISNRGEPKKLDYFPSTALVERDAVYNAARNYIKEKSSELSAPMLRGATIGRRIWHKT